MKAPIALFVYNRPEHTQKTLKNLANCIGAEDSSLYIFSDAAKKEKDSGSVKKVREIISHVDGFKEVNVIIREENMGLARSIETGVEELAEKFNVVIVLEDDLIVRPGLLEFFNAGLEKYKDHDEIMQISGYLFPISDLGDKSAFFIPLTTSWGWATWKRAWKNYDKSAMGYEKLKNDPKLKYNFNLGEAWEYYEMLELQIHGKIDSWAIRWYLTVFLNEGLVLYPPTSLIENIGFDGSGAHQDTDKSFSAKIQSGKEVTFPEEVRPSENMVAIVDWFSKQGGLKKKLRCLLKKLLFKINNIGKGGIRR